MRYDRAMVSLDRHATYIVAAFIAGAAWQVNSRQAHRRPPGRPGPAGQTARWADDALRRHRP